MAGATFRTVPLRGADFHLDMQELEAAFTREPPAGAQHAEQPGPEVCSTPVICRLSPTS